MGQDRLMALKMHASLEALLKDGHFLLQHYKRLHGMSQHEKEP